MLDSKPSRTALATAFLRAIHVYIDDAPALLEDPVAFELLPAYQRRFIRRLAALSPMWRRSYRLKYGAFTRMRTHVVVRARYAEDVLANARKLGVNRCVVLAAGLDTFALRQSAPVVDVLEIDHPATQTWKRELLAERGIEVPDHVTFLPVNFEHDALADRWVENSSPDFMSWLGITYYLTRDAISTTLRTISERSRPGSRLVLDYWQSAPTGAIGSSLLWGTRVAVALQQEPMRSFFEPAEIEDLAGAAGWDVREHCPPEEQHRRYLEGRADRLSVPSFAHLLHLERS